MSTIRIAKWMILILAAIARNVRRCKMCYSGCEWEVQGGDRAGECQRPAAVPCPRNEEDYPESSRIFMIERNNKQYPPDEKTGVLLTFFDTQSIENQYKEAQKNIVAMREHLLSDMACIEKLTKRIDFYKLLLYLSIVIVVIGWAGFILK
jgi:hypothetical protein